jgi:hypothetical protein
MARHATLRFNAVSFTDTTLMPGSTTEYKTPEMAPIPVDTDVAASPPYLLFENGDGRVRVSRVDVAWVDLCRHTAPVVGVLIAEGNDEHDTGTSGSKPMAPCSTADGSFYWRGK